MADVASWRVFAFKDEDEPGVHDELRLCAEWQVEDVFRWCRHRGYDNIYFRRVDEPARFEKQPPPEGLVHRYGP